MTQITASIQNTHKSTQQELNEHGSASDILDSTPHLSHTRNLIMLKGSTPPSYGPIEQSQSTTGGLLPSWFLFHICKHCSFYAILLKQNARKQPLRPYMLELHYSYFQQVWHSYVKYFMETVALILIFSDILHYIYYVNSVNSLILFFNKLILTKIKDDIPNYHYIYVNIQLYICM